MNGALRGAKGALFEGGHRVPFIARWPGKITPGTESAALIAHVDMATTFATLTGIPLPPDAAPDSFDVLPALLGQSPAGREHAIFHNGGQGPLALRMGPWKLIQTGNAQAASQLYNLAEDPAEKTNLAERNPDKAKELAAFLARARQAGRTRP